MEVCIGRCEMGLGSVWSLFPCSCLSAYAKAFWDLIKREGNITLTTTFVTFRSEDPGLLEQM